MLSVNDVLVLFQDEVVEELRKHKQFYFGTDLLTNDGTLFGRLCAELQRRVSMDYSMPDEEVNTFLTGQTVTPTDYKLVLANLSSAIIRRAAELVVNGANPSELVSIVNSRPLSTTAANRLVFSRLDSVDVTADDTNQVALKSCLHLVNSNTPGSGYRKGQLISVTAAPGSGKSLFVMNEAAGFVRQGFKVLYLALGDLDLHDLVSRFVSIYCNIPLSSSIVNLQQYQSALSDLGIMFSSVAPSEYTVQDVVAAISEYDYDVLIADYDSNFKTFSREALYLSSEETYNVLAGVAQNQKKLIFVCSQPKIENWDKDLLGLSSLAESSRKQHIVDMMIGIGRNRRSGEIFCGRVSLPKNRRGPSGLDLPYIVNSSGRFYEVSNEFYNNITRIDAPGDIRDKFLSVLVADRDYSVPERLLDPEVANRKDHELRRYLSTTTFDSILING